METSTYGNTPLSTGLSGSTDSTVGNVSSNAHAVVNSMANAADEAAQKAKPAIDRVAAMAHQAVETAAGAAAPTADWLAEQGQNLTAKQQKLVADTSHYVTNNPLKALGMAVAAGFLLSRITF